MAKNKEVGLTNYVTRILLIAFSSLLFILLFSVVLLQLFIQTNLIYPANAGEKEAQLAMEKFQKTPHFTDELNPTFYEYIYFDSSGKVQATSLSGKKLQ